MSLRLTGLVSACARVQERLRVGIIPDEVESFRREVAALVQQVELLCRQHGITPAQLPAPSARAYRFLAGLDLDALPLREAGETTGAGRRIRIANAIALTEQFAARMWRDLARLRQDAEAVAALHTEIASAARHIEELCKHGGTTSATLAPPSRQAYCWLAFLAGEDRLGRHLTALGRAREAVHGQALPERLPVIVLLLPGSALWRVQRYRDAIRLRVSEGFLDAGTEVWQALTARALMGAKRDDRMVEDYAATEEYAAVLFELEAHAPAAVAVRGRAHNLEASFARVNRAYFGGRLARPVLCWSNALTTRKFGHYQPARDTVMLSLTLDDPAVPEFLIDYVLYHELLHKHLGSRREGGRRLVHGPDFRAAERRFAHSAEAEAALRALALRAAKRD